VAAKYNPVFRLNGQDRICVTNLHESVACDGVKFRTPHWPASVFFKFSAALTNYTKRLSASPAGLCVGTLIRNLVQVVGPVFFLSL